MKTLAEIFEHTLQDVYYAENAITKALPKVAKAAKPTAERANQQEIAHSPFGESFVSKKLFGILCVLGGLCVRL